MSPVRAWSRRLAAHDAWREPGHLSAKRRRPTRNGAQIILRRPAQRQWQTLWNMPGRRTLWTAALWTAAVWNAALRKAALQAPMAAALRVAAPQTSRL